MTGRNFTKEFKLQVVQEVLSGRPVAELCREHSLYASLICRWRKDYQQNWSIFTPKMFDLPNLEMALIIAKVLLDLGHNI